MMVSLLFLLFIRVKVEVRVRSTVPARYANIFVPIDRENHQFLKK